MIQIYNKTVKYIQIYISHITMTEALTVYG